MEYQPLSELNILVTGGAGFIGSNIVDHLLQNNAKLVRVIDDLSTGSYKNIEEYIDHPNFEFIQGSITDYDLCMTAMKNIDVICHQAALGSVPRSIENPINTNRNNVTGALNIFDAARIAGVKRIVYASSSSVYGDTQVFPKVEDKIGMQLSPYAVSKYTDELYAKVFSNLYGIETVGLRYFNIFGEKQNPGGPYAAVIPLFILNTLNNETSYINGDGSFSRDFTYVANAVSANVKAMTIKNTDAVNGKVYNVACGDATSIKQLYEKITAILKSDLKPVYRDVRKGDIAHSHASIDLITNNLGYKVLQNIDEGLAKTVAYYKNNFFRYS